MITLSDILGLPYVNHSDRKNLPETPGIYFLVADDKLIVYVGMTATSFRKRWKGHTLNLSISHVTHFAPDYGWQNPRFKIYYFERIKLTRNELLKLEKRCIKQLSRPAWNYKGVNFDDLWQFFGVKQEKLLELEPEPEMTEAELWQGWQKYMAYLHDCLCQDVEPVIDPRYHYLF